MIIIDGRSLHLRTISRIPSLAAGGRENKTGVISQVD